MRGLAAMEIHANGPTPPGLLKMKFKTEKKAIRQRIHDAIRRCEVTTKLLTLERNRGRIEAYEFALMILERIERKCQGNERDKSA